MGTWNKSIASSSQTHWLQPGYRVLSFIGLGGVLLASSFVAARFRAPVGPSPEDP